MKPLLIIILTVVLLQVAAIAQTLNLKDIMNNIRGSYPTLKMYDAAIESQDAAAKGAKTWMPPQVSTGFWMTPYNTALWSGTKATPTIPAQIGMGSYMISVEQMFPNKKYNDANDAYMKAISSVTKENKNEIINELIASAKNNYYSWIVIEKKLSMLDESEKLLQFMITNAETRYTNGLGKISAYYKAKASLGNIENERLELQNQLVQKRIALNTLMNRDKLTSFSVDTNYMFADYSKLVFDSALFYHSRSDIRAIDQNIQLIQLQQNIEQANLKPQFGIEYGNMFGFGGSPIMFNLMGTAKIPMKWSTRSNKANLESLKWKSKSLEEQKVAMANEYAGEAYQIQQDIFTKQKQVRLFEINIIPALRKNYQSILLAYEQNTEELFELYDAWETLNSSQIEYLDQLQQVLSRQVDLEKLLEVK
jgi:outer membrane protein TolC